MSSPSYTSSSLLHLPSTLLFAFQQGELWQHLHTHHLQFSPSLSTPAGSPCPQSALSSSYHRASHPLFHLLFALDQLSSRLLSQLDQNQCLYFHIRLYKIFFSSVSSYLLQRLSQSTFASFHSFSKAPLIVSLVFF